MRRAMLTFPRASGLTLPGDIAIGDPIGGGYYAGIIDTTRGNIIAADASQAGLRYALIVAPKSLEVTREHTTSGNTAAIPTAARTRWNGLAATEAMALPIHPAADYCYSLAHPSDGASPWYLPAMDELELLYRVFKPAAQANHVGSSDGGHLFPGGTVTSGVNPSSDPTGAAYSSTIPAQTSVLPFRRGGEQALSGTVWSATTANAYSSAWRQMSVYSYPEYGAYDGQQNFERAFYAYRVRPVRRLVL